MRSIKNVLAVAGCVLLLTGCSNAVAEIPDGNKVMIKVGDHSITKSDMFASMKANGAEMIYNDAMNVVYDAEVPVTEELQAQADESYANFEQAYGGYMNTLLDYYKTDKEGYIRDYILPEIRFHELQTRYVDEHMSDLITKYEPVMVSELSYGDAESAQNALEGLKDTVPENEQFIAVVDSSDGIHSNDLITAMKTSEKNSWQIYTDDDASEYFLYYTRDLDPEADKTALSSAFAGLESVASDVSDHYLKQHKFKVYDIDLYNLISQAHPDLFEKK